MNWLSFGNQFDHHSVVTVNRDRLKPGDIVSCLLNTQEVLYDETILVFTSFFSQPHDSFTNFRGNRLQLYLGFTAVAPSTVPPRCFIYTNLLKLFDRLKMCLSRISRPIRRGPVFNRLRPRKPLFGQLLQWVASLA